MAINTDSIVNISSGGIDYGEIGISKTLDSLDLDDVFDSVYCSASCQTLCAPKQSYNAPSAFFEDVTTPLTFVSQEYGRWNYGNQEICYNLASGTDNSADPLYARVIWLYSEGSFNTNINSDNASGYSLVTQLNAQQWDIDVSDLSNYDSWGNRPKPTAFTDTDIEFMPFFRLYIYEENDTAHSGNRLRYTEINPYLIYKFNDKICITSLWMFETWHSQGLKYVQDDETNYAQSNMFQCYDKSTRFSFDTSMATESPIRLRGLESDYDFFGTDYTEDYIMYFHKVYSTQEHYFEAAPQNLNALNTWVCRCGFFFKTDKRYKPLISGGYVTGYTDDLTAASDFDNYTGDMQHDVPDTPGPPVPPTPVDPWDVDPETYGWGGGEVSGMVKYYLLTAGQMGDLQTAIASNANWTIDYLNCVVSCFVVPNSGIFFDAPISTTVKFKLDNATQWDTGVACSRIQGTKNKSGGTIEIPRLTHTFYDFEPYSDYSVYIPFCGRIPIKGNLCLGREIKVTYYPDVPTCSLTAVVSCGGATIAIAKGSFGTMTPVTSNGSDRKTAAVIGDVAPIITGIGTGIVGVALGNPLIVGAGAAQALGGIMGGVKETVQSYAYSVGSTGDSSFFGAGNRCYYYANYPIIDEVVEDSMFGHSVGYLCNSVGKLSSFTGFTICANPHVTFSATSEEKEEIERLLSMGVIL